MNSKLKRLLLLRHAKSDWSVNVPDNQRQLNKRGRKAAERMGRYIREEGLIPDRVLCSPAARATETWRLAQSHLDPAPEIEFVETLYDFGSGTNLLDVIRHYGDGADRLMVVGHNPSLEGLASLLTRTGKQEALTAMHSKYPTAALAVIDFEFERWRDVAPASGILVSFTRPRELPE